MECEASAATTGLNSMSGRFEIDISSRHIIGWDKRGGRPTVCTMHLAIIGCYITKRTRLDHSEQSSNLAVLVQTCLCAKQSVSYSKKINASTGIHWVFHGPIWSLGTFDWSFSFEIWTVRKNRENLFQMFIFSWYSIQIFPALGFIHGWRLPYANCNDLRLLVHVLKEFKANSQVNGGLI